MGDHLNGGRSMPETSWLPCPTTTRGSPRCAALATGLNGVAVSLIGARVVRRTVIRSAKNLPSSRTGTNGRETACTTPYLSGTAANTSFREPPRGHQNSSASLRSTQSASCSVAARRAIRVTHSA